MIDFLLHFFGLCPDSMAHPNLINFLAYHFTQFKGILYGIRISWFNNRKKQN